MQVEKSEALTCLLRVDTQDTTFGDKEHDYCRLKLVAHRHLEQKKQDSHFKARNRDEDRTCNWTSEQRNSERERQRKCKNKNTSLRGDCIRRITEGQCSFGDSCAFKHEPNKKGKGKGRPRSPSPTGSLHRNSKGDGKGGVDGCNRHRHILVIIRRGKIHRVHFARGRKGKEIIMDIAQERVHNCRFVF